MSASLNAKELAERLGLSKARISQYVSQGKLAGCFSGDGRARRFDFAKVAEALGQRLDLGQMMGNGAETKRVIKSAATAPENQPTTGPVPAPMPRAAVEPREIDAYDDARTQIAQQDARRKTRDNEREEGRWVLAEEVQRNTANLMAQEIAQFELLLRDSARAVADQFGVDFREVRQLLMGQWRDHRGKRFNDAQIAAADADMNEAEREADV